MSKELKDLEASFRDCWYLFRALRRIARLRGVPFERIHFLPFRNEIKRRLGKIRAFKSENQIWISKDER